jgi:hypothetical protein
VRRDRPHELRRAGPFRHLTDGRRLDVVERPALLDPALRRGPPAGLAAA